MILDRCKSNLILGNYNTTVNLFLHQSNATPTLHEYEINLQLNFFKKKKKYKYA
jgi:hypothetical protein